tara:strand:+ start:451 stop:786 length:336 start_codon:yes stop_codon:yes gene_type:complete
MKETILEEFNNTIISPIIKIILKQFLCLYNKPVVCYPLANFVDTEPPNSLLDALNFINIIEKSLEKKVRCIKKIVFNKFYINSIDLRTLGKNLYNKECSQYLLNFTTNEFN